jgi:hypothetical protein
VLIVRPVRSMRSILTSAVGNLILRTMSSTATRSGGTLKGVAVDAVDAVDILSGLLRRGS